MRLRAGQILADGHAGDDFARRSARLRTPMVVHDRQGSPHSWFVPLAVGETLIGFVQLLTDLSFMRYASFQRAPGALAGCPPVAAWTDPTVVRARAAERLRSGEALGDARLTFDGNPSRVVWSVAASPTDGTPRQIFVAGDLAYDGPEQDP